MQIYVPSRGRADRLEILRWFNPAQLRFVVPYGERAAYLARGLDVWETPEDVKGISATRNWIMGMHRREDGKLLMMDDDLRFYARERLGVMEENRTLRIATPDDISAMLSALELALEEHAHAAISPRQFNNALPDKPRIYGRYFRFFALNPALIPGWPISSPLEVGEDLELAVQLYKMGLPAQIFSIWAHDDSRGTNSRGGCSSYRDHEMQERSIRKMAELHAPFVQVVEKRVKMGGEFGHRLDPKIDWRGLYEHGQANLHRHQN